MKKAVVVGSGAGGATAAKELQGSYDVTILEAGGEFSPFSMGLSAVRTIKKTGLMFDEREIMLLFPSMNIMISDDNLVLVRGIGLGGTTTLATGNGLRLDGIMRTWEIDLSAEYDELEREIPVSTDHQKRWHTTTRRLFDVCASMGLSPQPTPKMGDNRKCIRCGRCILGCQQGAKWDSRHFLQDAIDRGASVVTHCKVQRIAIDGMKASGVYVRKGWRSGFIPADLIVLAAGGFGTPAILQASGIACEQKLFVDPVVCLAARFDGASQDNEVAMPFVVQREGYILSPYLDYLSYFFRDNWRYDLNDTLCLMIKIADSGVGGLENGKVRKLLTREDKERIRRGTEDCHKIFQGMGIGPEDTLCGTSNAGHPGGMLPLTGKETETFHPSRLPVNVYVADASLIPSSLGNPPIFTIMAMAKRVSRICKSLYC